MSRLLNYTLFLLFLAFYTTDVVLGADTVFQTNRAVLGQPNSTNKSFLFNLGLGGSNPLIRANGGTNILEASNDGSTFFPLVAATSVGAQSNTLSNLGVAAAAASNALTINLTDKTGATPSGSSIVSIGFRNSTLTTGDFNLRTVTSALSVTAPAGATLGAVSLVSSYVYVYAIDNAGTVELALTTTPFVDEGLLVSTTALSGSSTNAYTLYSTTARSNVPARLIGRIQSVNNGGNWTASPTQASVVPFGPTGIRSEIHLMYGNGAGSTNTNVRRFTTTVLNLGSDVTYADSASLGATFTINTVGIYSIHWAYRTTGACDAAITKNQTSQFTTAVNSLTSPELFVLKTASNPGAAITTVVSTTEILAPGDIIRAVHICNDDVDTWHNDFTISKVNN